MSKRRKKDTVSELRWIANVLRSPRTWIVLAWIGTFAVIANGLNKLDPFVQRLNFGDTRIEWVGVPDWLTGRQWRHVLDDLEEKVNLHPDSMPYDSRVCPWVAEQLSDSPWISSVRRVCKLYDGRVRVYADFRRPFAVIERAGIAYLIDEAGVRLPEQWPGYASNRSGWLVMQGVKQGVPALGERWPGPDVVDGLKLIRYLYSAERAGRLPFRQELRAIDVTNYDGKQDRYAGRLRLITKSPESYIHWGRPPEEEYGVESSAEMKLAMLASLYSTANGLPDEGPIDVRTENLIGIGTPSK